MRFPGHPSWLTSFSPETPLPVRIRAIDSPEKYACSAHTNAGLQLLSTWDLRWHLLVRPRRFAMLDLDLAREVRWPRSRIKAHQPCQN